MIFDWLRLCITGMSCPHARVTANLRRKVKSLQAELDSLKQEVRRSYPNNMDPNAIPQYRQSLNDSFEGRMFSALSSPLSDPSDDYDREDEGPIVCPVGDMLTVKQTIQRQNLDEELDAIAKKIEAVRGKKSGLTISIVTHVTFP